MEFSIIVSQSIRECQQNIRKNGNPCDFTAVSGADGLSRADDRTRLHYGAPGGNAGWQQSTGLLHFHGFESVAISGAGDRTRLHYRAPGVEPPDGNSPPDCCIFIGSNPAAFSAPKIGAPLEGAPIFGAGDRTRTCTAMPEEPKSTESTNSTTPACCL